MTAWIPAERASGRIRLALSMVEPDKPLEHVALIPGRYGYSLSIFDSKAKRDRFLQGEMGRMMRPCACVCGCHIRTRQPDICARCDRGRHSIA